VPFSLSSSLCAGVGKRTQKPLGAHQDRFGDGNEGEDDCFVLQTKLWFLYWKFNIVRSLYINAFFHHSRGITPINVYFLLCLVRQEGFNPNKRTNFLLAKQRIF
jgi:hypothetical protein